MNSKYFSLILIIFLQLNSFTTAKCQHKPSTDVVVTHDSQYEKSKTKDVWADLRKALNIVKIPFAQYENSKAKDVVANLRKELSSAEIPVASAEQINKTSVLRQKIYEAVNHNTYVRGDPVPDSINKQLNAQKKDLLGPSPLLAEDGDGTIENVVDETKANTDAGISIKEDLSNPVADSVTDHWTNRITNGHSIFMRTPTFLKTFGQPSLPILQKTRNDFLGKLFAGQK